MIGRPDPGSVLAQQKVERRRDQGEPGNKRLIVAAETQEGPMLITVRCNRRLEDNFKLGRICFQAGRGDKVAEVTDFFTHKLALAGINGQIRSWKARKVLPEIKETLFEGT